MLAKPEKGRQAEAMLLQMAQTGQVLVNFPFFASTYPINSFGLKPRVNRSGIIMILIVMKKVLITEVEQMSSGRGFAFFLV